MTKVRPPLSIDGALGRIAGQLPGAWTEMAEIVGRSERHVRRWGDRDAPDLLPLQFAIELDIAHARTGATDRPLFDLYALKLGLPACAASDDGRTLAHSVCALIHEGAEAEEAMVIASMPTATAAQRREAVRQLEDVVRVATHAIALLGELAARPEPPP